MTKATIVTMLAGPMIAELPTYRLTLLVIRRRTFSFVPFNFAFAFASAAASDITAALVLPTFRLILATRMMTFMSETATISEATSTIVHPISA